MAASKASPSAKSSPITARPKKPAQTKNLMVKILLNSRFLAQFPTNTEPQSMLVDPAPVVKNEPSTIHSATSTSIPAETAVNTPVDNGSPTDSTTPVPSVFDDASAMPPPSSTTIVKAEVKKGTKRSSDAAGLIAKPRAKPGPKKKKLEDGTVVTTNTGGPKLGPKANQGAINAGLRALDRSGKPCRKWSRGKFEIKSFTGAAWGIGRWTAPAKISNTADSPSLSGGSSKGPKEDINSQPTKSDQNSINTPDLTTTVSQEILVLPPSPMPLTVAEA